MLEEVLGRPPGLKEMDDAEGYPSSRPYLDRFGSWNKALKAAGIEVIFQKKAPSKKDLTRLLKQIYEAKGRIPVQADFSSDPDLPDPRWFSRDFGSWNGAIKEVFKLRRGHGQSWSKREIERSTVEFIQKRHRLPQKSDFRPENYLPGFTTVRAKYGTLENLIRKCGSDYQQDFELWIRWEKICRKAAKALYGNIKRGDIPGIDGLVDIYIPKKKLVIDAMTTAYINDQKKSEVKRYTSGGNRLEFWCLRRGGEIKHRSLRYVYQSEIAERLRANRKHAIAKQIEAEGISEAGAYTAEDIIRFLRRISKLVNGVPEQGQLSSLREKGEPTYTTIRKFYVTYGKALEAAGIETPPCEERKIKRYLRSEFKNKGTISCYEEVALRYNITDKTRFDRHFGRYGTFVKGCGLPPEKIRPFEVGIYVKVLKGHVEKLSEPLSKDKFIAENPAINSRTFTSQQSWKKLVESAEYSPSSQKAEEAVRVLKQYYDRCEDPAGLTMESFLNSNPSVSRNTIYAHCGGWEGLIQASGLELSGITEDDLRNNLRELSDELGRVPKTTDLNSGLGRYSMSRYYKSYGSFDEALVDAGIIEEIRTTISKKELKDTIKKLVNLYDRPPYWREFCDHLGYTPSQSIQRYYGTWNYALSEVIGHVNKETYADEELISFLKEAKKQLGRSPKNYEMSELGYPGSTTYVNRFGSWNDALRLAGLRENVRSYTEQELTNLLKRLHSELGKIPRVKDMDSAEGYPSSRPFINVFGSWKNALEKAVFAAKNTRLTDRELLEQLTRLSRILGKAPTQREADHSSICPSANTFVRRFGSWTKAVEKMKK